MEDARQPERISNGSVLDRLQKRGEYTGAISAHQYA